jgi:hypothetical protein
MSHAHNHKCNTKSTYRLCGRGSPRRTKLVHSKIARFAERLLFLKGLSIIYNRRTKSEWYVENLAYNFGWPIFLHGLLPFYNEADKSWVVSGLAHSYGRSNIPSEILFATPIKPDQYLEFSVQIWMAPTCLPKHVTQVQLRAKAEWYE